ncbi:hypothetical protein FPHOBKDP_00094 [Listeria phage LPJP1]|nr:hypothetical protein FPHOBKDP_00094 [Listeria phage LPJP1]
MGAITDGIKDMITDVIETIPVLGSLVGAFTENLDGSQLYYPDLWSNSTFDRSYNLEFRFYTPYGDPRAIFNYVYVPFVSLLVLGLPLQDAYYSYKQPFLVRMSCPGRFECECGVISSINMVRGEEQTWTAENFPREVTVSMQVRDLYPNLMASKRIKQLRYNIGLTSYIECMAGMRYDELNLMKRIKTNLLMTRDRAVQVLSFRSLDNKFKDIKYGIGQKVLKFLR